MTTEVGLPASRAVVAFAEGNDRQVIDALLPIRNTFQTFGGSHAQRDALQRTLLTSAIRAGELDLATALVNERLATRESSVYSLSRFARDRQRTSRSRQRAALREGRRDLPQPVRSGDLTPPSLRYRPRIESNPPPECVEPGPDHGVVGSIGFTVTVTDTVVEATVVMLGVVVAAGRAS